MSRGTPAMAQETRVMGLAIHRCQEFHGTIVIDGEREVAYTLELSGAHDDDLKRASDEITKRLCPSELATGTGL